MLQDYLTILVRCALRFNLKLKFYLMQFNRIRYYVFFHDISLLFLSQFTRLSHFKKNLVKHEDDSLLISGILPESSQHSGVCRFDFLPIKLMQIMFSVAHPYLPF